MSRSRWCWIALIVVTGAAAVCVPAAQTGSPQQPETGPIPTFRTSANLVLLDVVVRDRSKPVEGLQQSDFQVLEDGKPQAITVFEEHKATDLQESARAPMLPPHMYSNLPQYRIMSAVNVLLLDALNTAQSDQAYARAQMLTSLHAIPAGTQIAVFTLGSRLRMISGFTTDVEAIERALNPNRTPTPKSILLDSSSDAVAQKQIAERQSAVETIAGNRDPIQQMNEFEKDRLTFQTEERMDITLRAFGELARYLSTVPGRKNLIWVSGGLSGALDADLSRLSSRQVARFAPAMRTVNAQLSQARVAVYPVDARALMNLPDSNPANVVAPTEMGAPHDTQAAVQEAVNNDITVPQQWGESQLEMKRVAADTGGEAYFNTNAVGKAVEAAIADGENYYTLGYVPPGVKDDGAYHRITVRMAKGKYELAYRRGYFAVDLVKAAVETPVLSPMTEAMEPGVPPLSQVLFRAQVLPAGDPELRGVQPAPGPAGKPPEPLQPPVTRYFVTYTIDPGQLVWKDMPGEKKQVELEVTQAAYSTEGKRLNSTDAGLEATLTAAQMAHAAQTGVRLRQEIDMPAGPVWLELGVRDATSGRIGTLELRLNRRQ